MVEEDWNAHVTEVGQYAGVLADRVAAERHGAHDVICINDVVKVFCTGMPLNLFLVG